MSDRPGAVPGWSTQEGSVLRFDWGPHGLRALAPHCEVIVVVDVLSFSTCVSVAVERGAEVVPYRWHDGTEAEAARVAGAELAGRGPGEGRWWLSPSSLSTVPAGTRVLLPSPNGSALSDSAARDHGAVVLAGCLRNAAAVGRAARELASGGPVGVVAAGERWRGATGPLRPAAEDLLGAGAVLASAGAGTDRSVEAAAAVGAFRAAGDLTEALLGCASGRELVARDRRDDVLLAAALDATTVVPVLDDGTFRGRSGGVGELGP